MQTLGCCRSRGHDDKIVTMDWRPQMKRRTFSREFKLEAVKLVTERGVAVVQACRDLELSEIAALRKEVARLKAECDILKKATAFFARDAT